VEEAAIGRYASAEVGASFVRDRQGAALQVH
jgi:hypothetical protein